MTRDLGDERMLILQRYKEALSSDPALSFKSFFAREDHCPYTTMLDGCRRCSINIKDLKSEVRDRKMSELQGSRDSSSSSFIQFAPAKAPMMPSTLQGGSITIPDGVNLTLQESSVENCHQPPDHTPWPALCDVLEALSDEISAMPLGR